MMNLAILCLFLVQFACSRAIVANRTDDILQLHAKFDESNNDFSAESNLCSVRIQSSLDKLRKLPTAVTSSGFIDLSGYALHQVLRNVPFDMYVTDIKVRTPGVGNWARVEKCQFSNRENRLVARMLFNDLAVTGNIKLFQENSLLKEQPLPGDFCSMTARLRRAGLGINAFPTRGRSKGIEVRTQARFVDPNYLSIHAYGCKLNPITRRKDNGKFLEDENHRYFETKTQFRNYPKENRPQVRIVTLMPNIPGQENPTSVLQLHREDETDLNDYHKERILGVKFQNERDRLQAILHVKNIIAQQANQVFQAHGPFSHLQQNVPRPPFESNVQNSYSAHRPVSIVSSITELDENLAPIRPVQQGPLPDMFYNDKIVTATQANGDDLSREMEDMFLRGIKTLLTKYLEKQLEIPLKEALMVNIGYTVSYG